MKKIVIYSVHAVGMHHHGKRSLNVRLGYMANPDPENPYDKKAIAICDRESGSRKEVAYLKRPEAAKISDIHSKHIIEGTILIKPKFEPVFR